MTSISYTHNVTVNAFLLYKEKFLLLKRAYKPLIWGPPGGKLTINEDPIRGLQREVLEETGLQILVFQPVTTWFGLFDDLPLLSIDYLCSCKKNTVLLSHEHSEYRWLTITDLMQNKNIYFSSNLGFKYSEFKLAWETHLMNNRLDSI